MSREASYWPWRRSGQPRMRLQARVPAVGHWRASACNPCSSPACQRTCWQRRGGDDSGASPCCKLHACCCVAPFVPVMPPARPYAEESSDDEEAPDAVPFKGLAKKPVKPRARQVGCCHACCFAQLPCKPLRKAQAWRRLQPLLPAYPCWRALPPRIMRLRRVAAFFPR
mgnify:CR=1 FL=1